METTTDTTSLAYKVGYADGLAWDLDGFASHEDVQMERHGWDVAHCGITVTEGDEWEKACADFNAGAHAGACAPQSERTGKAPVSDDAI